MRKNPAKFDRCVKKVKAKGGAANAYAVCTAAGTRKKNRRKRNPADGAAAAFEEFHGRPSEEVITVTRKVHFHGHLAALGKLEALHVETAEAEKVKLRGFKGAILCQNEKGTQLFIEGGDQRVDLNAFGLKVPHERQDLGCVRKIEYFTKKDHLGSEGGTAIFVHAFEKPYPHLIYDVSNEQLEFAGGRYVILPEGIDH
jgi:hypothetical protein